MLILVNFQVTQRYRYRYCMLATILLSLVLAQASSLSYQKLPYVKHALSCDVGIANAILRCRSAVSNDYSHHSSLLSHPTALGEGLMGSVTSSSIRFLPVIPQIPLLAIYIPVLLWGVSWSRTGSWKSARSNIHRIGGVLTLTLPLLFSVYEAFSSQHVHPALFLGCIGVIVGNVAAGASLISRKVPAYDIPTLRAFAVGTLLASAFVSQSLFFRFGSLAAYEPVGKGLALVSTYAVLYAWSDALQHTFKFLKGDFKLEIGRKWYLPFQRPTLKHIFFDCLIKQPTKEGLDASVSPANFVTMFTTLLTAVFASISLLQLRYWFSGAAGVQTLTKRHADLMRWSCYEALLAVVANNFGTFAGTLVIQNRVSQRVAGIFNAMGVFIPVLNFLALVFGRPEVAAGLWQTSFGRV